MIAVGSGVLRNLNEKKGEEEDKKKSFLFPKRNPFSVRIQTSPLHEHNLNNQHDTFRYQGSVNFCAFEIL